MFLYFIFSRSKFCSIAIEVINWNYFYFVLRFQSGNVTLFSFILSFPSQNLFTLSTFSIEVVNRISEFYLFPFSSTWKFPLSRNYSFYLILFFAIFYSIFFFLVSTTFLFFIFPTFSRTFENPGNNSFLLVVL